MKPVSTVLRRNSYRVEGTPRKSSQFFTAFDSLKLPLVVRLSPATFNGCVWLFPLVFEVAFLEKDGDDFATGQLVVTGDRINRFFDVDEHVTHTRPSLSFCVKLAEIASHGISLASGLQPGRRIEDDSQSNQCTLEQGGHSEVIGRRTKN